jgi:hypothetical protein
MKILVVAGKIVDANIAVREKADSRTGQRAASRPKWEDAQ